MGRQDRARTVAIGIVRSYALESMFLAKLTAEDWFSRYVGTGANKTPMPRGMGASSESWPRLSCW